jgi:MFS family permease
MGLLDTLSPPRMGSSFRWLMASSWTTNLADGIAISSGPLLVASQTSDPLLVAAAGLLQRLPWVLFGLHAGVIADRLDRRRLVVAVNLLRGAVLAVLGIAIVADTVNVGVVLVAMFLLGTGETFADITASTLLPMIVNDEDLGVANARLTVGHVTVNQLVGPPLGAFLFAAGMASPFVAQATLLALGAMLATRMVTTVVPERKPASSMRAEIGEGIRWLWQHPPVRTLTLTILSFNLTFGSTLAILVLYASERLGLDEVGFGLLTTVLAVGGIVGSVLYGRLEAWLGMATLMKIGLVIETLTHLSLALTTTPLVAMAIFAIFGVHESVWGTTVNTIRQRAVPTELQGRVGSVYLLGLMAGLVVGAALGGLIARQWGITGPFWFAFVGSSLILAIIWRQLDQIATDASHEIGQIGSDTFGQAE